LEEIAKFIEKNVGSAASAPPAAPASFADPLTGGGRYIPSGANLPPSSAPAGMDPLTGGGRYIPSGANMPLPSASDGSPFTETRYRPNGGAAAPPPSAPASAPTLTSKYVPHRVGPLVFKTTDQMPKIAAKLEEFNAVVGPERLSSAELTLLLESVLPKLAKPASGPSVIMTDAECAVVERIMQWPVQYVFPALDVGRLALANPGCASYIFGKRDGAVLWNVLKCLKDPDAPPQVVVLGCRFLCNMFTNRIVSDAAAK